MPSNKELKTQAKEIAAGANIEVDTDGLNNKQLVDLVASLSTAEVLEPVAGNLGIYIIAEGKSVTCKKGILSHGDEIKPEYVGGDQFNLDKLIEKGYVVKV